MTFSQLFNRGNNNQIGDFNTQQNSSSDTSKKKKNTDDKISIYYFLPNDTSARNLDTSITTLNRNPILSVWQNDLGNFGTVQNSLFFNPITTAQVTLGIESIAPYLFTKENIKYYNTTRPYTDLYYRMGSKQEQIIELVHTQNIKPNWNFAVDYRKMGSPGNYQSQRTNHDNFFASTNYLSQNKRYQFLGNFIYNKLLQDENGGIMSDTFLRNPFYSNHKLIPVSIDAFSRNRSTVSNYFRNVSLNFTHHYFLGKYDTTKVDSSEQVLTFKPIFGIQHQFYSNFQFSRFKDLSPDSTFYLPLNFPTFSLRDSLYSMHYLNTIGNAFSLLGNIRFRNKMLKTEAGYGIEIETPHHSNFDKTYLNNFLFAKFNKSSLNIKEWEYQALAKFYFLGERTIGNFNLQAQAGKIISPTIGKILIGFEQSLQTAPYLFSDFNTNYLRLESNFSKQSISKIYLKNYNEKYKTTIQFNYYVIGNYIYRDSTLIAQQYSKVVPVFQGLLSKKITWKKIVFDNDVLIQFASNRSPIHLPTVATRHRLAHESELIKKKLQTAVGLDIRYNTPFYNDSYSPLYFSFVTNYTNRIANYPQTALFFNFKVKRFRSTIALDELQSIFIKNNMNYYLYPAQNFTVRFGFHWAFIN